MIFDQITDRRNTGSLKWDVAEGELPMWVADMDFRQHRESRKDLSDAVAHGIYGYSEGKDDYFQAAAGWYEKHFGWKVEKEMADQDTGRGVRTCDGSEGLHKRKVMQFFCNSRFTIRSAK